MEQEKLKSKSEICISKDQGADLCAETKTFVSTRNLLFSEFFWVFEKYLQLHSFLNLVPLISLGLVISSGSVPSGLNKRKVFTLRNYCL